MRSRLVVALLVALLAALAGAVYVLYFRGPPRTEWRIGDYHFYVPRLPGQRARAMHTIFLERHGVTLTAGVDDSTRDVSSVVQGSHRERVVVPAFHGSDAAWRAFVACMRQRYAPFDVALVESRPAVRGYILVAVGGTPDLVGAHGNVTGLAPYNGDPIEDAVVFVFSRAVHESLDVMCDTAAMETAHAYGLDHEYNCRDPMTYLPSCGPRSFQDVDASCGEQRRRRCQDGAQTQNSYRRLLSALGPAPQP
jgi:hypothetical protein